MSVWSYEEALRQKFAQEEQARQELRGRESERRKASAARELERVLVGR